MFIDSFPKTYCMPHSKIESSTTENNLDQHSMVKPSQMFVIVILKGGMQYLFQKALNERTTLGDYNYFCQWCLNSKSPFVMND